MNAYERVDAVHHRVNACLIARDRPELTSDTIDAIQRRQGVVLTIVDDASNPETASLIRQRRRYGACTTRNEEPKGVGGSKNQCVALSSEWFGRGEWLYLSDNDAGFRVGWLDTLIRTYERFEADGVRLVGGYAHPFNGTNRVFEEDGFTFHEKNAVDGISWLMRWETWDKYGPLMDNARGVMQSEDWEWCQRVRNDGFRVGVAYPHPIVNRGLINTFGNEIPGIKEVREQQASVTTWWLV